MAIRKVMLVASHGGHWVQLMRLAPVFKGFDLHFVSTNFGVASEVEPAAYSLVPDANLKSRIGLVRLAFRMFWIVLLNRPSVVVSTGAAPGFFALLFGKMIGARTIWIDSIANAEELSVSGAKVKPFADLWLTQWPHLAREGGPKYMGAVT